jgi:hypothetical protein
LSAVADLSLSSDGIFVFTCGEQVEPACGGARLCIVGVCQRMTECNVGTKCVVVALTLDVCRKSSKLNEGSMPARQGERELVRGRGFMRTRMRWQQPSTCE